MVELLHTLLGGLDPALLEAAVDPLLQTDLGGWTQGDFFDAGLERLREVAPLTAFAVMVAIPLYLALYWWSKHHTVPIVTLTLMGGSVFGLLPSAAARTGYILILLAGATALFVLLWAVIR